MSFVFAEKYKASWSETERLDIPPFLQEADELAIPMILALNRTNKNRQ